MAKQILEHNIVMKDVKEAVAKIVIQKVIGQMEQKTQKGTISSDEDIQKMLSECAPVDAEIRIQHVKEAVAKIEQEVKRQESPKKRTRITSRMSESNFIDDMLENQKNRTESFHRRAERRQNL